MKKDLTLSNLKFPSKIICKRQKKKIFFKKSKYLGEAQIKNFSEGLRKQNFIKKLSLNFELYYP